MRTLRIFIFFLLLGALKTFGQEACNNGIDDDGDGFIDCFDQDCANNSFCDGTFLGNDVSCQAQPAQFPTFSMALEWSSDNKTAVHFGRMGVGDLDNDGIPEVVTFNTYDEMVYILNGDDGSVKFSKDVSAEYRRRFKHDIAIGNLDGDNCGEIFIFGRNNADKEYRITSYDCNLNELWFRDVGPDYPGSMGLADFNRDGSIELYYKNEILNAHTGAVIVAGVGDFDDLADGTVAVDIQGDGDLELVEGGNIYDVDLAAGTATVTASMPGYNIQGDFSSSSVADYNQDGNLDIIATGGDAAGIATVFFWDITNGTVLSYGDAFGNGDYEFGWKKGMGRVNIADIDGDGNLNATYVSGEYLYALDENMNQLWRSQINEQSSGFTGCTLFDFNGDNVSEIVYRDEEWLYIIDGSTGNQYPGAAVACISRTGIEYPIVADVDGDGATELCVTCGFDNDDAWDNFWNIEFAENSHVRVFESAGEPWVPARRLWNQHAYFNVNVNDDLTIPPVQQKHHLAFSSGSCTTGPNRPLNSFLNQSPFLDSDGCPVYASPDLAFVDNSLSVQQPTCPDQDFLVSFQIQNLGDVDLSGDLPITFYEGDPSLTSVNKLNTETVTVTNMAPGNVIDVNNLTVNGTGAAFVLYIVLNDDGSTIPLNLPNTDFFECDYSNNILSENIVPIPFSLSAETTDNSVCDAALPGSGSARAYRLVGGVEETADYTFHWHDGNTVNGAADFTGPVYSNLTDGDYTVFAVHNTAGCSSDTMTVTVNLVPATVTAAIILQNQYTSCANPNGHLLAEVNGGDPVGMFTYEWYQGDNIFTSPLIGTSYSITGLGPGQYTLLVTEKSTGCQTIETYTIIDDSNVPGVTASATDASCPDPSSGTVTANVTGGNAGHSFEWYIGTSVKPTADYTGNSVNNLPAGDYTVVATNNSDQCSSSPVTVTVNIPSDPVVTASMVTEQTSCDTSNPNGSVTASVGGVTTGYTFTWYQGQGTTGTIVGNVASTNGLSAGPYTVEVTDDLTGCSATAEVTITETLTHPTVSASVDSDQTDCLPPNGQVSASVGGAIAGYTFYWFDGNVGTPDINNPDATGVTYSGLTAGDYTVVAVNNSTQCASASVVAQVADNTVFPNVVASKTDNTACDPSLANGSIAAGVGTVGTVAGYTFHIFSGQNTLPVNELAGSPSDNISGLSAGIYTIQAIDNTTGCANTTEITISNNIDQPNLSAVGTDVMNCSPLDGSITAGVDVGNVANYTFSWYNGNAVKPTPDYAVTGNVLSGLDAGTYTVTAFNDVLGCPVQSPQTVTITRGPGTVITLTELPGELIIPSDCNVAGGQLGVAASAPGNTGGFNFTWYQGDINTTMTLIGNGSDFPVNSNRLSGLLSGRYTVIATDNDTGCQDSLVVDLPYTESPAVINVLVRDNDHCTVRNGEFTVEVQPSPATLATHPTLTPDWYQVEVWKDGVMVDFQPGAVPNNIFVGLGAGDYSVLVREVNPALGGCVTSENETINDLAVPPAVTTNALVANRNCMGTTGTGSISLTIDGVPNPATGYDYNWYQGQTTSDPALPAANVTVPGHTAFDLRGGYYTVEVIDNTDPSNTCSTTATYFVADDFFVVTLNNSDISLTHQTDCAPPLAGDATVTDVYVDGVSNGGTAGFTFEWFESDGTTLIAGAGTGDSPLVNLAPGSYFVQATDMTSTCPSSLVSFEILDNTIAPNVVLVEGASNSTCDMVSHLPNGQLSASVTEGMTTGVTAGYTFEWFSGQNNTNPADALPAANVTGADNEIAQNLPPGFYTVRVTDVVNPNNTCQTIATMEVRSNPEIVMIAAADITINDQTTCSPINGSAVVNAVIVNGVSQPTAGFTYDWYESDGVTLIAGAGNGPAIGVNLASGTYFVQATSNSTGCATSLVTFEIQDLRALPVIDLVSFTNPTQCAQPNILGELSVTADGSTNTTDFTFTWYQGTDATGTLIPGNNPVINNITSGGNFYLEVTNNNTNCISSAQFTLLTEIPPILLSANATDVTDCVNPDGTLFATVTSGNSNNYDYNWYIGNTVSGTPDFTGKNIMNRDMGDYTIVAVDQSDPGCTSVPLTLTIGDGRMYPQVELLQINPVTNCDPSRPNGAARASAGGTGTGYTFEWFVGSGVSGVPFYTGSQANDLSAITYTVLATNLTTGCTTIEEITIEENLPQMPLPDPEIISNQTSCVASNGAISVSVDGITAGYIFAWYNGQNTSGTSFATGDLLTGLNPGFYTVTATDINSGCVSEGVTVEVIEDLAYPEFEFVIKNADCNQSNGSIKLNLTSQVIIQSIVWETPTGAVFGPSLVGYPAGDYEVTITTDLGCTATRSATILPNIIPYNGVSFNGDGLNDFFVVSCLELYPNNQVKIFNRAGTLVYETDGYNNADNIFDGTANKGISVLGSKLPSGTYFYVIDKRDNSATVSGYLELLNE